MLPVVLKSGVRRMTRLRIVLATGTALAATAFALATIPAFAAGSVTAAFTADSDWGSGYQGKYTISNGGSTATSAWKVEFDLPAGSTLGSYWDTLASQSGQHVTATNRTYNAPVPPTTRTPTPPVAPGASVSFGFLVSGGGKPTNCRINGAACTGGGDGGGGGP